MPIIQALLQRLIQSHLLAVIDELVLIVFRLRRRIRRLVGSLLLERLEFIGSPAHLPNRALLSQRRVKDYSVLLKLLFVDLGSLDVIYVFILDLLIVNAIALCACFNNFFRPHGIRHSPCRSLFVKVGARRRELRLQLVQQPGRELARWLPDRLLRSSLIPHVDAALLLLKLHLLIIHFSYLDYIC